MRWQKDPQLTVECPLKVESLKALILKLCTRTGESLQPEMPHHEKTLISMMAASAPKQVDAVVDPCVDAVDRFLKWETDGAKRALAVERACARVLDEDVALAMGDCGFEWLRGCAFVVRDGDIIRWCGS